jgi:LmbE family N-acetylglucosaminyl deacetylase
VIGLGAHGDRPRPVLVVVAHPDDETLGAGGTIARLTAEGREVWVCIVCDGVTARHTETRRQRECAERACEVIGVTNLVFCDLPDQRLDALDLIDVIRPIEHCVQDLRPDTVLTQFKEDVNQDHRVVFAATMVATRPGPSCPVRTLMCFETASSTEWAAPLPGSVFAPNVFVDVSATLDRKIEAMSMYAQTYMSEVQPYPHPRSYEAIEVYAKRQGVVAGMAAAEPFMLLRGVV